MISSFSILRSISRTGLEISLFLFAFITHQPFASTHVVTFDLADHGSLLLGDLVQEVADGGSAIPPEFAVADGWSFTGWDSSFSDVSTTRTVQAEYAPEDSVGIVETKLLGDPNSSGQYFGSSVSINGETAVIGSANISAAFVYVKENGLWSRQVKITPSDPDLTQFGTSVSISGDTIAVSAHKNATLEDSAKGIVYVYVRRNGVWTEQVKLTTDPGVNASTFSSSPRISLHNNTLAVGVRNESPKGFRSGSVYVFNRLNEQWSKQARIIPTDGASNDWFGSSVGVSGDVLVIGAPGDDDKGTNGGSAYVYTRESGNWTMQAKLTADDGSRHDSFGSSVSVSGNTVAVGAYGDDDNGFDSGSVYVYMWQDGAWSEQAKLGASDGAKDDFLVILFLSREIRLSQAQLKIAIMETPVEALTSTADTTGSGLSKGFWLPAMEAKATASETP